MASYPSEPSGPSGPFHLTFEDLGPPSSKLLPKIRRPSYEGYPTVRSPIVHGTDQLDVMWKDAAKGKEVYTKEISTSSQNYRKKGVATKCLHLQTLFWGRIAKVNQYNYSSRGGLGDPIMWSGEEMSAMLHWFRLFFNCPEPYSSDDGMWRLVLENSPWWDCPLYEHLLYNKGFEADGTPLLNHEGRNAWDMRDPKSAALEREFLEIWRERGIGMPVRRMQDDRVVCREMYAEWVAEVGEGAAADWYRQAYDGL